MHAVTKSTSRIRSCCIAGVFPIFQKGINTSFLPAHISEVSLITSFHISSYYYLLFQYSIEPPFAMHFQQSTILASAGLLATTAFASPIEKRVQCTNGAVVFAVRGSDPNWSSLDTNPAYNQLPQGMTNVANAIISKAGSGYLQAVAYPAINPPTNNYADYDPSVQDGVKALTNDILAYVNACPNGKIFVMGYSQGGQVVSSALGGTSENSAIKAHNRST